MQLCCHQWRLRGRKLQRRCGACSETCHSARACRRPAAPIRGRLCRHGLHLLSQTLLIPYGAQRSDGSRCASVNAQRNQMCRQRSSKRVNEAPCAPAEETAPDSRALGRQPAFKIEHCVGPGSNVHSRLGVLSPPFPCAGRGTASARNARKVRPRAAGFAAVRGSSGAVASGRGGLHGLRRSFRQRCGAHTALRSKASGVRLLP